VDLNTGDKAPAFELPDLEGSSHSSKALRGKPAVLVFGEVYNRNTLSALKDLDRLLNVEKLGESGAPVVLVMASKEDPRKIRRELRKVGYRGELLVLRDRTRVVFQEYGIKVLPTTFVIDTKGQVSLGFSGYPLSYSDMVADGLLYALGKIERDRLDAALSPTTRSEGGGEPTRALRIARMARALSRRDFHDAALERYRSALDLDPDLVEAHVGLADCLLSLNRIQEAETHYAMALDISPETDSAIAGLARIEIRRGQLEAAEKRLRERLAVRPLNAELHYLAGETSEKRGDKEAALAAYKRAAQLLLIRHGND
jgi:tetratricopeptide (TPR) repeat protein